VNLRDALIACGDLVPAEVAEAMRAIEDDGKPCLRLDAEGREAAKRHQAWRPRSRPVDAPPIQRTR